VNRDRLHTNWGCRNLGIGNAALIPWITSKLLVIKALLGCWRYAGVANFKQNRRDEASETRVSGSVCGGPLDCQNTSVIVSVWG
jgi:hypothetical protein